MYLVCTHSAQTIKLTQHTTPIAKCRWTHHQSATKTPTTTETQSRDHQDTSRTDTKKMLPTNILRHNHFLPSPSPSQQQQQQHHHHNSIIIIFFLFFFFFINHARIIISSSNIIIITTKNTSPPHPHFSFSTHSNSCTGAGGHVLL